MEDKSKIFEERFKKNDVLNQYTQTFFNSNSRSRKILIIIIFASIVSFISYWDSRPDSWARNRYKVFQNARDYILNLNELDSLKEKITLYNRAILDTNCYECKDNIFIGNQIIFIKNQINILNNKLNDLTQQEIREIENFIEIRNLRNVKDWEEAGQLYNELLKETFVVKIGLLNTNFDINDLGIFSGITLCVLLLFYWYSTERTMENLQVIRRLSKYFNCTEYYYYYLSSEQVFTLPPKDSRKRKWIWNMVPYTLIMVALFVQICIIINDFTTLYFGFAINVNATTELISLSSIFTMIIAILTINIIMLEVKINNEWKDWFLELEFKVFGNDNSIKIK